MQPDTVRGSSSSRLPRTIIAKAAAAASAVAGRQWPALAAGAVLWLSVSLLGASLQPTTAIELSPLAPTASLELWWEIVIRNCGIGLWLFTGVVTFGITTIGLTILSALTFGLLIAQAISQAGHIEFLAHVAPHLALEMLGFIIATASGLTVLIAALRRFRGTPLRLGRIALDALILQASACVLLAISAAIETWIST